MSLSTMTIVQPVIATRREARSLVRYARPALGLLLPMGLAIAWEIAVRLGYSD